MNCLNRVMKYSCTGLFNIGKSRLHSATKLFHGCHSLDFNLAYIYPPSTLPKPKKLETQEPKSLSYTDLFIIRHGETEWNKAGRVQGHKDVPLNEAGITQANSLRAKFLGTHFKYVFSSDLQRAIKTAEVITALQRTQMVIHKSLRERWIGPWDGVSEDQLKKLLEKKNFDDLLSREKYLSYKWTTEMESYAEIYKRFFEVIQSHLPLLWGTKALISTHGGVLKSVLYNLLYEENIRWKVSNCAHLVLRISKQGTFALHSYEGISKIKSSTYC